MGSISRVSKAELASRGRKGALTVFGRITRWAVPRSLRSWRQTHRRDQWLRNVVQAAEGWLNGGEPIDASRGRVEIGGEVIGAFDTRQCVESEPTVVYVNRRGGDTSTPSQNTWENNSVDTLPSCAMNVDGKTTKTE